MHQCERSQRRLKIHSGGWYDITRSARRGIEQIRIKGCGGSKACVRVVGLHSRCAKHVFCRDQYCFDPPLSFEGENLKQDWSVGTICRFDVYRGNEKETLMDLVSDTRLHARERNCCHIIHSVFWDIMSAFKSIWNNSFFAIASCQVLFLLMWLRVISDNEVIKCSALHQLHKSYRCVWLRISIFYHLALQGRIGKKKQKKKNQMNAPSVKTFPIFFTLF